MRDPTPLDDFLFDLNGYLVVKDALEPDLLDRLNAEFDQFPRDIPHGHWYRGAQRRDYTAETGLELHNCVHLGEPFEELIDHPGYIRLVRHYGGEEASYVEGLFIDECIASIRVTGGHHPVHSGGFRGALRGRYLYTNGVFRCGMINVICALSDIGPGDGPTMVVPASHKSNCDHPLRGDYGRGDRMDELVGAIPVYMHRGDALLFVDGLMHGGSSRTNPGERRITIYRYGPLWGATRYGYQYSRELLDRLTPERRKVLEPVPPIEAGETWIPQNR
ncbi:MAG: phytanoyl-CoA dioxygenase family protein [Armatimonadetes bacterium]|nr:phytanoyl-CoA dioxygenase family protein [Armatimonadota bacterium]